MTVQEYLTHHVLMFDGAMGTYFSARNPRNNAPCELANLTHPQEISAIHREYLAAGAGAIKTNTFAANRGTFDEETCRKVIAAGYRLAKEAAGDAFVFADIGPIAVGGGGSLFAEYRFVAETFLREGATHFLFETLAGDEGILETAAYIKAQAPEGTIFVSISAQPDGFTRSGQFFAPLLQRLSQDKHIDGVGLNCGCGARHMAALMDQLPPTKTPRCAMPNAGYPTVLGSRTYYHSDPDYFAAQLCALAQQGARILGGCCGTTPRYIAAAVHALKSPAAPASPAPQPQNRAAAVPVHSAFWDALCDPAQKPFAVELDPPEGADAEKFMAGARELQQSGASIITIADCPIARARMDASLLACKLRRELSMEAMPHMTCRDRNLNATKALLLGLSAEDIRNVLVVTGDPIPSASRDEVKSVYNFNSRMLAQYISSLSQSVLPSPFRVFGALNVNAVNFRVQLNLAKEKAAHGVCGFFTQPVLTHEGLENLKLARETLDGKILGGIIPIVSHKNACFMNSEVSGITLDPAIIALYEGKDRAAGEDLAVEISVAAARAMSPYVDGFYLITPFGRTGLMARIMEAIGNPPSA